MNQDRRSTFRCVSPSSTEPAILRAGRKDISAKIVEESAEGMGVRIEAQALSLKTDDLVSLTTASRRVSAQVVHVLDDEEGTRLGLVKLRDLGFAPSLAGGSVLRQAAGVGSSFMRFGLALAVCLGMFLGGVILPIDWNKLGLNAGRVSAATPPSARLAARPQGLDSNLRLGDLNSKEFAEFMELSPQQQDRISRIVNETLSVMSLLHANRGAQSPEAAATMGMQTLQASWRQIQMELTPEQQAKWRELTGA